MYEKTIQRELARARQIPISTFAYKGSEIILFRADLCEAGIKHAIGRGLVAQALDNGQISNATKALVVQGAGNTVTAVHEAAQQMELGLDVIAVIYAETSQRVKNRLVGRGLKVVSEASRTDGQTGRRSIAATLCAENPGYTIIEQHEQPTIIDIQKRTFGTRIAEAMTQPPTHFVAGVGTGGTLFGIGTALREINPDLHVTGVEGVGSTLSLWHAYLAAKGSGFKKERSAIERALKTYRNAGMITQLDCYPDAHPDDWFDVKIEFPAGTEGVLGIEGLGVGHPTDLIMEHLPSISKVQIITDAQARKGMLVLAGQGIHAVESAGANIFASMKIAESLDSVRRTGKIVTIVTAAKQFK